ncbi:MAG: cold shock domain-containing protein, partial [Bacteroidetes bacterium]|nr:cold shock domain-containing protein [Bacteroidota bacterium]
PDHGGKDLFVHFSEINADGFKSLEEGDHVEYEVAEGPKGLNAKDVHLV